MVSWWNRKVLHCRLFGSWAHLQIAHVEDLLEDAGTPAERRSAVERLADPRAGWSPPTAEALMADLALACLKKRPKQRPSAAAVIAKLRDISGASR